MTPLDSAHLKVLWAEQHRDALRALLEAYFRVKQGEILAEVTGSAYAVIAPAIPWQVPFIVGDCLQSLRTSLDYLARDLCLSSGGNPTKYTSFPVCKTLKCFQSAITQRALGGIPVAAVNEIEKLQPYLSEGGDPEASNLWILHELCNINKHRRILLMLLQVYDDYAAPVDRRDHGAEGILDSGDPKLDRELVASIAIKEEGIVIARDLLAFVNSMINFVDKVTMPKFERFLAT